MHTPHTPEMPLFFNAIIYELKFKLKHEPPGAHFLIRKVLSLALQRGKILHN